MLIYIGVRPSELDAATLEAMQSALNVQSTVGAFHGILPHTANIDNRSATVLICKCPLLCNSIPIATTERYCCVYALLWECCCIATATCRLVLLRIGYRCSQHVAGFHGRLPHYFPGDVAFNHYRISCPRCV
jgi:hypothetical protein